MRRHRVWRFIAIGLVGTVTAILLTIGIIHFGNIEIGHFVAAGVNNPGQEIKIGKDFTGPKVTLYLKQDPQIMKSFPDVKDVPKTTVAITLPLYPGARADTATPPEAIGSPMTPYVVAAGANYILPVESETAKQWFNERLIALEYQNNGSGTAGNNQTGIFSTYLMFNYQGDSNLQLVLNFKATGNGQTSFQYWATYILVPKRPQNSFLPTDMVKANLTYGKTNNGGKIHKANLTDPQLIDKLVAEINSLPRSTGGIGGCTADDGTRAAITFNTSKNLSFQVIENPACRLVTIDGGPPLYDKDNSVSKLVSDITGRN